jgi:hypothetical protein
MFATFPPPNALRSINRNAYGCIHQIQVFLEPICNVSRENHWHEVCPGDTTRQDADMVEYAYEPAQIIIVLTTNTSVQGLSMSVTHGFLDFDARPGATQIVSMEVAIVFHA